MVDGYAQFWTNKEKEIQLVCSVCTPNHRATYHNDWVNVAQVATHQHRLICQHTHHTHSVNINSTSTHATILSTSTDLFLFLFFSVRERNSAIEECNANKAINRFSDASVIYRQETVWIVAWNYKFISLHFRRNSTYFSFNFSSGIRSFFFFLFLVLWDKYLRWTPCRAHVFFFSFFHWHLIFDWRISWRHFKFRKSWRCFFRLPSNRWNFLI